MTSEDRRPQERRFDDDRCVDALLAEGGFPDDAGLRDVLLQLRELRVTEVPEPSPEVAALLARPGGADVVSLNDWSHRHPRKKRIAFTTLAVAASLGVAGGAAAGNETLRSQAEATISGIIRSFSPPAPTPEQTTTAPASPPAEAPRPAAVGPSTLGTPATVPAVPVPVPVPAAEPSAGERQAVSPAPERGRQASRCVGALEPVSHIDAKPAAPGASHPNDAESQTSRPSMVGTLGHANAKVGADNGVGTSQGVVGQDSARQVSSKPNVDPAQANRR